MYTTRAQYHYIIIRLSYYISETTPISPHTDSHFTCNAVHETLQTPPSTQQLQQNHMKPMYIWCTPRHMTTTCTSHVRETVYLPPWPTDGLYWWEWGHCCGWNSRRRPVQTYSLPLVGRCPNLPCHLGLTTAGHTWDPNRGSTMRDHTTTAVYIYICMLISGRY